MDPDFSSRVVFGSHSVLIPVARVEISLAPEAGTTSQAHLHPQSNSSCWRHIYSHSQYHLVPAAHTDTENQNILRFTIPFYTHFCLPPLFFFFLPCPFLLHSPLSVCMVLLASQASGYSGLHPCQQSPYLLQFLASPLVSVLDSFASCLCLHYIYLSLLCVCIFCPWLLPFLCHPLCLGLSLVVLLK